MLELAKRVSLGILIAAMLATISGCEVIPIPTAENWKQGTLADGNYKIKFPYQPEAQQVVQQNGDKKITSETLSSTYRNEIGFNASVAQLGIEEPQNANSDNILNSSVASAAEKAKCKTEEMGEIRVNEQIQGRDFLLIGKSGDHFRTQIYFSKTTGNLYQASVFGESKAIVYGENAKTFFDSIEIETEAE